MKIFRMILILMSLFLSSVNVGFAANYESEHNLRIADFVIKRRISPFEMPVLSFNYFKFDYKPVEVASGNKVFKKNAKHVFYEIDIEKPMYKKYISYGLTWGLGFGINPFTAFTSDTVLYIKAKAPIYLGYVGDIGLFVSGGLGVSIFTFGYSGSQEDSVAAVGTALGVDNYSKPIELRRGLVKIFKYGIDYYPIQWFGITLGFQTKTYDYAQSQFIGTDKEKSARKLTFADKFSFVVKNSFFFSIRTTF